MSGPVLTKVYLQENTVVIERGDLDFYIPSSVVRMVNVGDNIKLNDPLIDFVISFLWQALRDENDQSFASLQDALDYIIGLSGIGGGSSSDGYVNTPFLMKNSDLNIYADGAPGRPQVDGREGWYFRNSTDLTNKINWYYINNAFVTTSQTLETLQGGYAIITPDQVGAPYFNVYTKRQNDGQDYSWYRSRITYLTYNALDNYIGQTVLIYWGQEPNIFPNLPRVEMVQDDVKGPNQPSEEIFLSALNTSTGYPAGTYAFVTQSLGYIDNKKNHNFPLKSDFDATALTQQITDLQAFMTAVETGRFFRGYVADQAEMDALANPLIHEYVVRIDTETIWEYDGANWVDTLTTASLTGIGTQDQQAAGYSNTHYIDLDGTNDLIDLDTGVNANVLDYTQSWALGFEIENVSTINDSSYTTLFKRGTNEITLRKGGSNWGVYFYASGLSVAQANTWVAPQPGSKVLFVCNGTQLKYYLDGTLRSTTTINANVSQNNPVGNLEIGNGGQIGSNWFGGINNALIMEGAGSDMGTNQIAEYFGGQDVTTMSFYNDPEVQDFLPLGEDTYPAVTGTKSVISGNLINGTLSDFVARP